MNAFLQTIYEDKSETFTGDVKHHTSECTHHKAKISRDESKRNGLCADKAVYTSATKHQEICRRDGNEDDISRIKRRIRRQRANFQSQLNFQKRCERYRKQQEEYSRQQEDFSKTQEDFRKQREESWRQSKLEHEEFIKDIDALITRLSQDQREAKHVPVDHME